MKFTAADLTDRTPEAAEFAAARFKSVTTGFFRPAAWGIPICMGHGWRRGMVGRVRGSRYWTALCSANNLGWMISIFRGRRSADESSAPKSGAGSCTRPPARLPRVETSWALAWRPRCLDCGSGCPTPRSCDRSHGHQRYDLFPDMTEADLKAVVD